MFDVLTIAAVADEFADTLVDGRIQRIGLIDRLSLAAEIYAGGRRRWLVASSDARAGRLHLTEHPPSLDTALVTPFGLLLRKYARGGVVIGVEQPPLERLVRLSIAKRLGRHNGSRPRHADPPQPDDEEDADEAGWVDDNGEFDATYVHLVVELMGRHSNLLLVDDEGKIMESAKHVTSAMSRVRPIWPRLPYTPPPPVDKPDPRRLTAEGARALLSPEPPDALLAQVLVRRLRAVSPQMGREIAFRVGGTIEVTVGSLSPEKFIAVARETRALLEPLLTSAWAPRVYKGDEMDAAFSPVPLAHLAASGKEITLPTISAAIDAAFGEPDADSPSTHSQRRERLSQAIGEARKRVDARLASIDAQDAKAAQADRFREWGELIYAYLWQIESGQRELSVDGTTIPLDPALSAKENAQAYFERYRKAQGAAGHLPDLRATAERERAYLDQLLTMVAQADGFAAIEALTAEWEAHRGSSGTEGQRPSLPRRRATPGRPKPVMERNGNAIFVGRSGRENDLVTFDIAGPDDTWLHARGVPGSHVIVRWRQPGADEDPETIGEAASLAAYYSAARGSGNVEVDVTRRRHVRKIKGAGPGMVTYRQERTMAVRPAPEPPSARKPNAEQPLSRD
ncbi:MAG: NFACT family protein [Chloroflexota bacterium]|nr:NFACT family protein [Chloroflexota bacterium]